MLMFQPMNQSVPLHHQPGGGSITSVSLVQKHPSNQQKRSRDADGDSGQFHSAQQSLPALHTTTLPETYSAPLQSSPLTFKRSRPNKYEAPREVKPSILSAMGSLVGGGDSKSFVRVPLRRQLSGSAIDAFLGASDKMDMDQPAQPAGTNRPRSMSF